jgi:hypothetical protein
MPVSAPLLAQGVLIEHLRPMLEWLRDKETLATVRLFAYVDDGGGKLSFAKPEDDKQILAFVSATSVGEQGSPTGYLCDTGFLLNVLSAMPSGHACSMSLTEGTLAISVDYWATDESQTPAAVRRQAAVIRTSTSVAAVAVAVEGTQ